MKKISVIVPCYNVARYLDKCVDSLLCQTIGIADIEIILVDDASTDDGKTRKVIMDYEGRFPDTVMAIFLEQNMRQGGARNVGVAYAEGEYLLFCDADDWLLEETLEHCYQAAKRYDADIVEFARKKVCTRDGILSLEKGDRSTLLRTDTEEGKKELLLNILRGPGDSGSQNTLFNTALIKENQIAFLEYAFMEEILFVIPAKLYAERYYYLDETLYMYFLSPESTVRSNSWEDRKWDNLQAWVRLMEELKRRDLYSQYQQEMDYLFFIMGFGHCIQLIFQKGCILTNEEWKLATDITSGLIPDIRQDLYIKNETDPFNQAWNGLLLQLLDIEFTDERAQEVNQSMIACIQALWACPAFH